MSENEQPTEDSDAGAGHTEAETATGSGTAPLADTEAEIDPATGTAPLAETEVEAEAVPDTDTGSTTPTDPVQERRRTVLTRSLVAAAAVLAVAIGLLAWQTVSYLDARTAPQGDSSQIQERRAEVIDATHAQLKRMFGYDHRSIEEDMDTVLGGLTPEFAEQYEQVLRGGLIDDVLETQATVRVTTLDIAPMTVSGDSAQVLVFLKQVSNTNEQTAAVTWRSRAVVDLQRVDGRWLVGGIDTV